MVLYWNPAWEKKNGISTNRMSFCYLNWTNRCAQRASSILISYQLHNYSGKSCMLEGVCFGEEPCKHHQSAKLSVNTSLVQWFENHSNSPHASGSSSLKQEFGASWGFLGRDPTDLCTMLDELMVAMMPFEPRGECPPGTPCVLLLIRAWIYVHKCPGTHSLSLNVSACICVLTSPTNANQWLHDEKPERPQPGSSTPPESTQENVPLLTGNCGSSGWSTKT